MDARIHTLRDGTAIDNFLVQDPFGGRFDHPDQIVRIEQAIRDALSDRHRLMTRLHQRPMARTRAEAFDVAPNVLIDNGASNRFTVIEVTARDRPALLLNLAFALFQSKVTVHSAHVATYGERAIDTFYVTDLLGGKIESKQRLATLERRLLESIASDVDALLETAKIA
jgi:[protein-PII] uridylyltransferase